MIQTRDSLTTKKSPVTFFLIASLLFGLLLSCSQDGKKPSKSYLPIARGADGVILVVMDSALWVDSLGVELRRTLSEPVIGLPQDEPFFTIRQINPRKLNDILKAAKNMLFVTTLDQRSLQSRVMRKFMTDESIERIKTEPDLFRYSNKDAFARGQEVLHLFGQTQDQLISKIIENRSSIKNFFMEAEKKRISEEIFRKEEKNITKIIERDHQFSMKIPYGFDLAKQDKNFVWIRLLDPEYEKSVFVHYTDYTSKEPFDQPVEYRESITSVNMRDSQKNDLYMTTQKINHQIKEINFNGMYAKETRGLWMFSDISGGGAFVSYLFVDESQKRIYYLEGYVYAPGKDKRQFMREMEVVLSTFKSGEGLKVK
ncbi:MAG: hypothetical protein ACI8YP_002387 [Algoriphagus sp.]|jgi:hypothetical protein